MNNLIKQKHKFKCEVLTTYGYYTTVEIWAFSVYEAEKIANEKYVYCKGATNE